MAARVCVGEPSLFTALVTGRRTCSCRSACNAKGNFGLDQSSSGWFGIAAPASASPQGACGALAAVPLHVALQALTNVAVLCSPLLGRKKKKPTSLSREMRSRAPRCPWQSQALGPDAWLRCPGLQQRLGDDFAET